MSWASGRARPLALLLILLAWTFTPWRRRPRKPQKGGPGASRRSCGCRPTAEVNNDTGDTIDTLDDHVDFAAALHIEAQRGRFGLFGEGMHLDLVGERTSILGTTAEEQVESFRGVHVPILSKL